MGMQMDTTRSKKKRSKAIRIGRRHIYRAAHILFIMIMSIVCAFPAPGAPGSAITSGPSNTYAASFGTSGRIAAEDGAVLRSATSTDANKKAIIEKGTRVSIVREIFREDGKTAAETKWYLVKADGKKGYVRSDLVNEVCHTAVQGYTTGKVNYRTGPSVSYEKLGKLKAGAAVTILGKARLAGQSMWYKAQINGITSYISKKYITFDAPEAPATVSTEEQAAPAQTGSTPAAEQQAADTQAEQAAAQAQTDQASAAAAQSTQPAAPAASQQPAVSDASITVSGDSRPATLSPGTGFTIKGKVASQVSISKIVAGVTDAAGNWILSASADVNASSFDIYKLDSKIKFGTLQKGDYKYRVDVYIGDAVITKINSDFKVLGSELVPNLLANPTDGGRARIIGTFDKNNCTKLFGVTGTSRAKVPQGMTMNGDTYYLVYGMSGGQAIVAYSSSGKKLGAANFPFNMGHPNGITWDPQTGLCYIFRGYQYSCYTWDPATGKFGKASTPFSSSGIAYDARTNLLFASSRSGMREYSSDGKFAHNREFKRCSHGGKTYVQDCGAANGYLFHCVSGANKHKTNYLDVYREADGKYLGTIKINIDEAESAVVGSDGFVRILCNTTNNTDHIWKTPLNVNELS